MPNPILGIPRSITNLPAANEPLDGDELLVVVQQNTTRRSSTGAVLTLARDYTTAAEEAAAQAAAAQAAAEDAQAGARAAQAAAEAAVGDVGTGAPSGPAGGDLTGTYPNPTVASGAIAYGELAGVPSSFTPSAHVHAIADTTGLQAALDAKAASSHTHAQSDVTSLTSDLALKAPLASPALTGTPTAPTAGAGTSTTQIATTAFVATADGLKQDLDATLTALAGLNSTAGLVEQTGADAFTKRALGVGASTSVPTRADADTRYAAASHAHAQSDVTSLTADLALKAPLASPTFTGNPTAPTASPGDNDTSIATTAFVAAAVATAGGGRELLTANRTYYVRTDGNNSNTGLVDSAGGAWLTLQKAWDVISTTLDLGGFIAIVQVKDGTYTAGVLAYTFPVGIGLVRFQGNSGTPGNVIVSLGADHCFQTYGTGVYIAVRDMELRTLGFGDCLHAELGSEIDCQNVRFGTCASTHMAAAHGGIIYVTGSYSVVGGADIHLHAYAQGQIDLTFGITVTLTGTPTFTGTAYASLLGIIRVGGVTFSGPANGERYYVDANGVIDSAGAGASFIPGNVAGSTATGGQYV